MALNIEAIENGDSGLSVRLKLNQLIAAAMTGGLPGTVSPEDLDAAFDKTAPDKITGLALSSTLLPTPTLIATWDFSPALDFAHYDLQIDVGSGGHWESHTGVTERYTQAAIPGQLYRARIRAFDKSGNASDFSAIATLTVPGDLIPPAAPIDLSAVGGLGNVWLKWTPNTEEDFSFYEIFESSSGTTPADSVTATYATGNASYVRSGISGKQTLYYWTRAVDTSANRSPWSARASAQTSVSVQSDIVALVGVVFTPAQGTGNTLQWTAGAINYGPPGEAPATKSIASGSVDWSTGTLYVYYVRGGTTLSSTSDLVTMYSANGLLMGIYRGGTDFQLVEGKAKIDGADVLAQTIGANALVANEAVITGTAQIKDAIITSAKVINLDAVKIVAESIASNNALIGLINGANVAIGPGQIGISGSTTLADWRYGGDSTKIDGGNLAANTVAANSAVFGQRAIVLDGIEFNFNDPSTNYVSWTAGSISYLGDDGNIATRSISTGSAQWTSGTLYVIYVKGATAFSTTTNPAVAFAENATVLATYAGDTDLTANWGRTTIDGGSIKGIMAAFDSAEIDSLRTSILIADSITASMMNVVNLAAISTDLGSISGGSININNKFVVNSDGAVTIQSAATGAKLIITNSYIEMYS